VNDDGLTDFKTERSAVPGGGVAVGVGVAGSEVAVGGAAIEAALGQQLLEFQPLGAR